MSSLEAPVHQSGYNDVSTKLRSGHGSEVGMWTSCSSASSVCTVLYSFLRSLIVPEHVFIWEEWQSGQRSGLRFQWDVFVNSLYKLFDEVSLFPVKENDPLSVSRRWRRRHKSFVVFFLEADFFLPSPLCTVWPFWWHNLVEGMLSSSAAFSVLALLSRLWVCPVPDERALTRRLRVREQAHTKVFTC